METSHNEKQTNIAHTLTIELQFCNRHAPDDRQRNKMRKLFIPHKMLVPNMRTRMIQDSDSLTYGVVSLRFVLLIAIAAHTRIRKIVGNG